MDIAQEQKEKIEKIITEIKCAKKFICYRSGFDDLCKAKDLGMQDFVDCLEKPSKRCSFAISFGHGNFCRCPLRIYISKELKM